jgi:hypothetical protein
MEVLPVGLGRGAHATVAPVNRDKMTNEYRPRPNDRLVEPLFDGLEACADTDTKRTRVRFPWVMVVLLLAAIATGTGDTSILIWVLGVLLATALGLRLWGRKSRRG